MKLTREKKEKLVEEMKEEIENSKVVGILDMHSLPAKQLQQINKELKGEAVKMMSRKTLMELAIDKADKENIEDLKDNTAVQPAFIFTDSNPFKLYKMIQDKKSSAPASGGEIAPNDIVIEEGDTGIGPGPMIGELQQLGAQTSVEGGTIKVTQSSVAVEEGEIITPDIAKTLNRLDMKPLKVGLDLKLVHENGEILGKDVLAIDEEEYRQDFESAAAGAFNLAVNAGFINESTAEPIFIESIRKAKNLAVNATIFEKDVIEDILAQAYGQAQSLDSDMDMEKANTEKDSDESESEN